NALFDLLECFHRPRSVKVLVNRSHVGVHQQDFVNSYAENETNAKLQSQHRLKKVIGLLQDKMEIRQGDTGGMSFMVIDDTTYQFAPNNLTEPTLGVIKDGKPYMIFKVDDGAHTVRNAFENYWNHAIDCRPRITELLEHAGTMKYPELVYKFTLSKIFEHKTTEDINEERLKRTGFKNSVIWNKLFNFQRDAVLGAIDKIERYNGCIIADSVGLGKTFEALAVIKYYELRNDRVLVLAPKKLRENWITYTKNYQTNILEKD